MVKSERMKKYTDAGLKSDVPYESAIASIGGLVAGSTGLALFFCPRSMRLTYSYPFLCILGAGASIFGLVQLLIVRNSVQELVNLHWAAGKYKNNSRRVFAKNDFFFINEKPYLPFSCLVII